MKITKKILLLSTILTLIGILSITTYAKDLSVKGSIAHKYKDFIYYLDDDESGYLCKIKSDGTGYAKLHNINATKFLIVNDWIYYIKSDSIYHGEGQLYRIHINGTGEQKIYDNEWPVNNLEYSNGFLTFDAGDMYKMNLSDLKPILIDNWDHYDSVNHNGKLIAIEYDYIYHYDLATSAITSYAVEESIGDFVCDDEWIYYLEYNNRISRYKINKIKLDGSKKTTVLENLILAKKLQLFNGNLYYSAKTDFEEKDNYYALWKTSVNGSKPELITKDILESNIKIENVIDEMLYFSDSEYLAFYDLKTKKTQYMPLGNIYSSKQSIALNDASNVYFIKNNKLIEMTPNLVKKEIATNLKSLNGGKNNIGDASFIYSSTNHLALKGIRTNIMIIDLKKNTVYELNDTKDNYELTGLDSKYIYFKNRKGSKKLYRLAIGNQDISKKEFIWDVDELRFYDGFMLNQKSQPTHPSNELYKLDLKTLKESKISSVFIYDASISNGYLYYVRGNNGGIYKTSLTTNNTQKVYSYKKWAGDLVVNKDSIFVSTWRNGLKFVSTDLNGKNYQELSNDIIRHFIGATDRYVVYKSLFKFARYTPGSDKIELLSKLYENTVSTK